MALAVALIATPTAAMASPIPIPSRHPLLANVVDPVPAGFPSWEAVFDRQNLMMEALTAIRDAAPANNNGYASTIADQVSPPQKGPMENCQQPSIAP